MCLFIILYQEKVVRKLHQMRMTDIQKCEVYQETSKEKCTISTHHWKYAQRNADPEKEKIRNRFPLLALLQQNSKATWIHSRFRCVWLTKIGCLPRFSPFKASLYQISFRHYPKSKPL